jgi:Tol biopolymer transport system component
MARTEEISPEELPQLIQEYLDYLEHEQQIPEASRRVTPLAVNAQNGLIAYRGEDTNLWIMNPDGSNRHPITTNLSEVRVPDWSPDGRQVVFQASDDEGNNCIRVIDVDGSNLRTIVCDMSMNVMYFSPDGTKVLFDGSFPNAPSGVYVVDLEEGEATLVGAALGLSYVFGGSWSPDGRRLAFTGRGPDGRSRVYISDISNTQVVTLPVSFGCTPHCDCSGTSLAGYPSWSPRGDEIAFVGVRVTEEKRIGYYICTGHIGIYAVNADGTGTGELIKEVSTEGTGEVKWSPDGVHLAHALIKNNSWRMVILNRNERSANIVPELIGEHWGGHDWSPDGSKLVVSFAQKEDAEIFFKLSIVDRESLHYEEISPGWMGSWGTYPTRSPPFGKSYMPLLLSNYLRTEDMEP